MRADKSFLELIFEHIGSRLKHEVECLLIGGNAMIYYGLRESTKDVDLVFYDKKDVAGVSQIILSHPLYRNAKILRELPYKINPELLELGKPIVIGSKDLPRFDLFYKRVFRVDTTEMVKNSIRSVRFDLLKLKLVSLENLLFLKAVSGRPVDFEDIANVLKSLPVDWKRFLDLAKKYYKTDSRPVWFALGSFHDLNKKEKLIPRHVITEISGLFGVE